MTNMQDYLVGLKFMGQILQKAPDTNFLLGMAAMPDDLFLWPGIMPASAKKLRDALAGDITALAGALAADHLRLFSGPNPLAPPWESVWLEKDRLLFGDCTEKVAAIYKAWGVEIAHVNHEPEDHLGLELSFLAYLLELEQNQERQLCQHDLNPLETFRYLLNGHIMPFAPAVLKKVMTEAQTPFYRIACENCLLMLNDVKECPQK